MTYKDHGEIADIFRRHITSYDDHMEAEEINAITAVLDDIADYCQRDNPRFNRDRFMIGAGIGIV